MRGNVTPLTSGYRPLKRCILIFLAIALLPLLVVYFLIDDQMRHIGPMHQFTKRVSAFNFTSLVWPRAIDRPLSASEMQRIGDRMDARLAHLDDRCHAFGLHRRANDSLHRPNAWEFLVNRPHHLIWCNVFKAASTSWMYNFNILAGYSPAFLKKTNIVPLSLARRKYPRVTFAELQRAQNDSVTFLIVRHPFERLVSAYRDKFMFAVSQSYHDWLSKQIIRKYRKAKAVWIGTRWPSFDEFVQYLLDEHRRHAELNMHWTPIAQFCTPCQIRFDIVAKFETLDEDQRYVIARADLGRFIAPQWKNPGKGHKTADVNHKYYHQLSAQQIDGLYEMFRYDFELFGYDMTGYESKDAAEQGKTTAAAVTAPS